MIKGSMRIKVEISPKLSEMILPKSYLKAFSSCLFTKLNIPELKESRELKFFSFSPLRFEKFVTEDEKIRAYGSKGYFMLSSLETKVLEKTIGLEGEINIAGNLCDIVRKSPVLPPEFEEEMTWVPYSYAGIYTRDYASKKSISPKDNKELCVKILKRTLQSRWERLVQVDPDRAQTWSESSNPIKWAKENPPEVKIVDNCHQSWQHIKSEAGMLLWRTPVTVIAPVGWQSLIWETGLGTKTALGAGMVNYRK
jgi:CRISPR-associated endoribonuclease Cas6